MTVYRVEVVGPRPATADELALMLTSDDHYRTSNYIITVEVETPATHLEAQEAA